MRRMNSEGGIIDIVNEAIDEGRIEVGGGLPEIEEGDAGKVLMVNEAEDGVEWGEVEAGNSDTLVLDFNNQTTLQLTEDVATQINNKVYNTIIILNYNLANYKTRKLRFTLDSNISATYNGLMSSLRGDANANDLYYLDRAYIMPNNASNTSSDFYEANTGIHKTFISYLIYLNVDASYVLSLKYQSGASLDNIYSKLRKTIVLSSTSQTGTFDYPYWTQYQFRPFDAGFDGKAFFDIVIPVVDKIDSTTPYNIYMRIASSLALENDGIAYAYGERVEDSGVTYKYIMKIAKDKTYTITRIAA